MSAEKEGHEIPAMIRIFDFVPYAKCPNAQTFEKNSSYQCARTRYFSTEVPSLATGTLNCAAKAAVFVYL